MKNVKQFLTLMIGCFVAIVALGQELDDMYFNSKDRAKINEKKITADLGLARKASGLSEVNTRINPTDSYSARNINPEYASQLNNNNPALVEDDYFLPDFQPTGINQNISNCNCNTGSFYNPYFSNNAFNNPYYGFNNGFGYPYNSFYPSYWGNPYYGSGLSMSLGYGWGGFSPGFYNGAGFGSGYYANNFWNPYNPWGGNYFGNYYPRQVIIINNGGDTGTSRVSYAKRGSRSTNLSHQVDNSRPITGGNVVTTGRSNNTSGRTRSTTPEYYDSGWKRNQDTNPTRGYWGNSNNGTNSTRSDLNRGYTGGRQGTDFSSPSRSSFNNGGFNSGGSRSSGSSGSSGASRTRGRNN